MAELQTSLTKLLNIRHPILLAPMNACAGGALAAAVTEAGGLGLIGGGVADAGGIPVGRGPTRRTLDLLPWPTWPAVGSASRLREDNRP